jgi:uncharacterized protein YbjQ (UPF0145 family)
MILTTTNSIEGHQVIDYLGIVTETISFSVSIFENRRRIIENKKEEAFKKMTLNAIKLKANAILGIHFEIAVSSPNLFLITVVGTAVKVEV